MLACAGRPGFHSRVLAALLLCLFSASTKSASSFTPTQQFLHVGVTLTVMLVCPTNETGVVLSPCLITAHDSRPSALSCSVLARRPSSLHDEEGHAAIWLPRASKRYSFGCQQATSLHLQLRGGNVRISDDEDKHASGMEASEHADREKAPTEALDTVHKGKAKKEDKNEANEMIVSFHDALWVN